MVLQGIFLLRIHAFASFRLHDAYRSCPHQRRTVVRLRLQRAQGLTTARTLVATSA